MPKVPAPDSDIGRSLPLLPLLLAGSGCAALIYEIVWLQLLQLVIGSSAVSLALLLAAYMGGLCLGSVLLPRLVSPRYHPLRVYASLEIGVAFLGLLALFGVPLVGRLYLAGATQGTLGLILRGLVAAVCLLPPTLLMGASLPAIARWIQATPQGVSWLGFLYSGNIAGSVFGCLFAGFYLLRVYDMAVATWVAAAINLVVAGLSFAWSRRTVHNPPERLTSRAERTRTATLIYLAIAFSGLGALGAEVVWTRLLSLLLGATVYTFSIILAVFLIGLWGGSAVGSFLARRTTDARIALAACQVLLALAIAWTATPWRTRCRIGLSTPGCRSIPGSTSSSTWPVASGLSCRLRCCGVRAFRWPSQPRPDRRSMRGGLRARSTRPTRPGRSSGHCCSVFS